jgi:hypothetical protein
VSTIALSVLPLPLAMMKTVATRNAGNEDENVEAHSSDIQYSGNCASDEADNSVLNDLSIQSLIMRSPGHVPAQTDAAIAVIA